MTKGTLTAGAMLAVFAVAPASAGAQAVQRNVTQTPVGVQTSVPGSMSGVFTCSAHATPDAASVNIRSCELRTSSGEVFDDTITIQQTGPAGVTGSAFAAIPVQSFRVCMQTEVIWLTGEKQLLPERCS